MIAATAIALAATVLLGLGLGDASAQGTTAPADGGGGSDSTGRQLTDFNADLDVPGFDSSLGDLAAAELTISGSYDGQVIQILNQSGGTADFVVSTNVRLCVDPISAGTAGSYSSCAASASSTTVMFDTGVVQESFDALPAGAAGASAVPGSALDASTTVVLAPDALAAFVDAPSVTFGVATLAGFEALGGGGNSTVQVETYADVTLSVSYQYVSLDVVKLTNGVDTAVVTPGDAVEWTYDVTNTGNTAVSGVAVTDDLEGDVCVIAMILPSATESCSLTGVAGDAPYTNVATATGVAEINPAVSTSADDPSSYLQPEPTATPEPTVEPSPTPSDPAPAPIPGVDNPAVDIELSTNGVDADTPTGAVLAEGDPITWRYVVTNTGAVDLTNLVVTDDRVGGICTSAQLVIGQSFECTREGVAGRGQHVLVATVLGESGDGQTVTDRDPTHHITEEPDEVEGIVITPTVVPVVDVPDEVLALTGESGNGPAAIAMVIAGIGLVMLSGSEALRRRHTSLDG